MNNAIIDLSCSLNTGCLDLGHQSYNLVFKKIGPNVFPENIAKHYIIQAKQDKIFSGKIVYVSDGHIDLKYFCDYHKINSDFKIPGDNFDCPVSLVFYSDGSVGFGKDIKTSWKHNNTLKSLVEISQELSKQKLSISSKQTVKTL